MKALITVTAPTHYQLNSLRAFKLDTTNKSPYSSEMQAYSLFNTLGEAREYLKQLAANYYENDKKAIANNLGKNSLTLDACTGYILTSNEYVEFLESSNRKY